MADVKLDYQKMTQNALRGVVRAALEIAVKDGLPGEHHFFIAFSTGAPGVGISARLRERHPEEMTIVLQHQFWGLEVTPSKFTIKLSFDNIPETLVVPFTAVKGFLDPSVQFGLQFDIGAANAPDDKAQLTHDINETDKPVDTTGQQNGDEPADVKNPPAAGEVVNLDAFRKK